MSKRKKGPQFLWVGLTKTATTFMHQILIDHPDVWLPHSKETVYGWYSMNWMPKSIRDLKKNIKIFYDPKLIEAKRNYASLQDSSGAISKENEVWNNLYLSWKSSLSWYLNLFPDDQFSGEINPRYGTFDEREINTMRMKLGDIKIIISFRHPVDRIWSFIKMKSKFHGFDLQNMSSIESNNHFQFELCHANYYRIFSLWKKYFSNIKVLFYDQLVDDPQGYVSEVCEFLNIDPRPILVKENAIRKKVFQSRDLAIPTDIEKYIAATCIRDYDLPVLAKDLDAKIPVNWHNDMIDILAKHKY